MIKKAIFVAAFCLASILVCSGSARAQGSWVNYEGCYCGIHPLPPVRFEVIGSGTEAERSWAAAQMEYWNRYAAIFDPCVDSGKGAPNNGKNEVNVFMSPADAASIYGLVIDSDIYGITILIPQSSFGVFNECREFTASGCGGFTETDIIINGGYSSGWSTDPYDFSRAAVQPTALHELGHAWGAHHVFDLTGYGSNAYSCMNYMSDYGMMRVTRMDANTIRYAYPDREQSVTDIGIYPLKYGQGKYAEDYASAPSTAAAGSTITVGPVTVQNCGAGNQTNVAVKFYLSTDTVITSSDNYIGEFGWYSPNYLNENKEWSGSWNFTIPAGIGSGSYYIGAIVTVWGSEDAVAENNKMLLVDVNTVDGKEYPSGLRKISVTNWFPGNVPSPAPTPSAPSFPDCCTEWCGDNYLELDVSQSGIASGGALTLNYSCSFTDIDYYGVPVRVYLALIKNPKSAGGPSTIGQALSGGTDYLWTRGFRSNYIFRGRVHDPTWKRVSFPPLPTSGALNIRLTAPRGTYCWAAAFVNAQTGMFIRSDLQVENSNTFTVR